ncbi:hypothetical protein H6CHR_05197 [Variovorax sp. PBL-H6]|nr:hypothetical protein [Variovorax sp. PBL-H6]VTU38344.1 hypothetical protein H6CHR_05197 [Variovorax sp. PBL-H6]
MQSKHATLQPQDPVAARRGIYMTSATIAAAMVMFALSLLRG